MLGFEKEIEDFTQDCLRNTDLSELYRKKRIPENG